MDCTDVEVQGTCDSALSPQHEPVVAETAMSEGNNEMGYVPGKVLLRLRGLYFMAASSYH